MARPRSILRRLGTAWFVLCVLITAAGYVDLRARSAAIRADAARQELERAMTDAIAASAADDGEERPDQARPGSIAPRLTATGLRPADSVRFTWVADDGAVLADTHHAPAGMPSQRDLPEIREARRRDTGFAVRPSAMRGGPIACLARRLPPGAIGIDGRPAAFLRAAVPVDGSRAADVSLHRTLLATALLLTAVSGGALLLLHRGVRRAVAQVTLGVRRCAAGEFTRRIDPRTARETEELSEAMNALSADLDRRISQLERQRDEQRLILQSMSNGVIALDLDHRVLSLNEAAERMLRLSGDGSRGRLLVEIVRQPALDRLVHRAVAEGGQVRSEMALEGEPRLIVEATAQPLRSGHQETAGVLILLNDVTQLRRLEMLRSDFAANVSHELRTPITNIKGYVETLLEVGTDDQDQTRRFLEVIKGNSDRLAAIIEDLLSLARLEQPGARDAIERTEVTVASICAEVLGSLAATARAKSISIEVDVDRRLRFRVNRHLMEQALANLVSNAIKYSRPRTAVVIRAHAVEPGRVRITVRDHGPGIAAEHLPRLFERFYRVDKARSRELGGTGLGLAIVKHIALVHGGTIAVETTVGQGSSFILEVPAEPTGP